MSDALYVILHHRDDKTHKYRRPQYRNHWRDDERVQSISTTPHVANECKKERAAGKIVYVYRCPWKNIPSIISCAVRVTKISGSQIHPIVHFADVKAFSPRRTTAKQRLLARSSQSSNCYRQSARVVGHGAAMKHEDKEAPRMLTESEVIASVCRFLKKNRFRVTRFLSETERGIDIQALTPDGKQHVSIEAKGETSSKAGSGRFGKAFDSGQAWDHVSKAFYCAARDCSIGLISGNALPKNERHVKFVQKILPALKQLRIEVFWVLPNKRVETEQIWRMWDTGANKRGRRTKANRLRP